MSSNIKRFMPIIIIPIVIGLIFLMKKFYLLALILFIISSIFLFIYRRKFLKKPDKRAILIYKESCWLTLMIYMYLIMLLAPILALAGIYYKNPELQQIGLYLFYNMMFLSLLNVIIQIINKRRNK